MAVDAHRAPEPGATAPRTWADRLAVLGERDFGWFFVGYTTSLLGSSMAPVAVAFAVLGAGAAAATSGG
ncbi:hypothetical protein [Kitasatospora sp. NPDC005748]|uniref:hypothetical protein n=1 Tax=Kitasatospora sp. NPDC005748 TaxID=3157063 RepID=UPI0033C8F9B6